MATKEKVNKSLAVRDYLKANRNATNLEVAAALAKKGIVVTANYVANLKSQAKRKRRARKVAAATPAAAVPAFSSEAPAEKPTKAAETITLEQIRKVAETVKTIGGFARLHELLAVIKEVGGPKKFRELLEAMAVSQTDKIPF